MNSKFYKYCAVPQCRNTTIKTPEKLFINLPQRENVREKWLQLARKDSAFASTNTKVYFCEDHFDLPRDMENYMEYRIMGSVSQIRMKAGCLPSKFECQTDRKRCTEYATTRILDNKRQRLEMITECEREIQQADATLQPQSTRVSEVLPSINSDILQEVECVPMTTDKSIQVFMKPHFRSKSTQTTTMVRNIAISPVKSLTKCSSTSPFKWESCTKLVPSMRGRTEICKKLFSTEEQSDSEISLFTPPVVHSDSSPSISSVRIAQTLSESSSLNEQFIKQKEEEQTLRNTIKKIKKRPRFYIGVPKSCYYLIDIISKFADIPEEHILLCLKKIRLDSKFAELADEFVMSVPNVSKIFVNNVPIIADIMHTFIVKLDKNAIKKNLPIAFRHRYHYVSCIIDCLEIEIQKPSNAVNQALTWSDYKKANTAKYLISCTLDGLIHYISPGYGGRTSDVSVVENSNFLNCLESGACVMADRGFKHIEQFLLKAGSRLVRPPSVNTGSKLSKEEVHQTKQIASLRIHIERVIRRLREFAMLKPHACINNYMLKVLDEIVVIACGLINLQDSYIK